MNQKDLNVWIEKLITESRLSLEDICGSTESISVTIVEREGGEDRYSDSVSHHQFLKLDYTQLIAATPVTRTVYNGMLPSCNYISGHSPEWVYEVEMAVAAYFLQIGSGSTVYWNTPVVQHDLGLYDFLNLKEVVLPLHNGLPSTMDLADTLHVYQKSNHPTWATRASQLSTQIAQYGLTHITVKDSESTSSIFVPLNRVSQYSNQLLEGFIRTQFIKRPV